MFKVKQPFTPRSKVTPEGLLRLSVRPSVVTHVFGISHHQITFIYCIHYFLV